jgi:hypothetical protein
LTGIKGCGKNQLTLREAFPYRRRPDDESDQQRSARSHRKLTAGGVVVVTSRPRFLNEERGFLIFYATHHIDHG